MDPSAFWSTIAQVLPVFLLTFALEWRISREAPKWFRWVALFVVVLVAAAEVRAFHILGGAQELGADRHLALDVVGFAVAAIVTGAWVALFRSPSD